MNSKDIILLLVNILGSSMAAIIVQKVLEKKELVKKSKYRYVNVIKRIIEKSMVQYDKLMRAFVNCSDEEQACCLNGFVASIREVIRYYNQMQLMLKPLSKNMNKLIILNKRLYEIECNLENDPSEAVKIGELIHKMNEIAMRMQVECAYYKV